MPELTFALSDADVERIALAVSAKLSNPQCNTYTIPDLIKKLKLSRDTIVKRIRKGEFGAVLHDGRLYRITEDGLQHYFSLHNAQVYHSPSIGHKEVHKSPGRI